MRVFSPGGLSSGEELDQELELPRKRITLRGALLRSRAAASRRGISNAAMVLLGQSPAAQQLEESRDGGLAACNLAMRLCGGSAPSAYRPPLPRRSHVSPGVVSASAGGGRSQLRCGAPCKHGACSRTDTRTPCLRGHRRWSDDRRRPARAFGPGIVGLVASPALAWVRVPLIRPPRCTHTGTANGGRGHRTDSGSCTYT